MVQMAQESCYGKDTVDSPLLTPLHHTLGSNRCSNTQNMWAHDIDLHALTGLLATPCRISRNSGCPGFIPRSSEARCSAETE